MVQYFLCFQPNVYTAFDSSILFTLKYYSWKKHLTMAEEDKEQTCLDMPLRNDRF